MKKILLTTLITCIIGSSAFAQDSATQISTENYMLSNKEIKAQIYKIKTKRIIISNALRLNDSQKQKTNEIYSKNMEKEALLIAQLKKEQSILKELNEQKKNSLEKKQQRKIVYNLQKSLITLEKETDKEFKKVLTREQRSKFNRLSKEVHISDF